MVKYLDATALEGIVLLDLFAELPHPRQTGNMVHPLNEVLMLALLAVLSGADDFASIAEFGRLKLPLLREFLPFANETPDDDRIGELFAALDPEAFQQRFGSWVRSITGVPSVAVGANAKASRRSIARAKDNPVIQTVPLGAQQRMVLGQIQDDTKSSGIAAILALLEMLDIAGALVTIDIAECQRDIACKIKEKDADYIFATAGVEGSLHADIHSFVTEQRTREFAGMTLTRHEQTVGHDDRIVQHKTAVIHDVEWLQRLDDWPGLSGVIIIDTAADIAGEITHETRYYVTSSTATAEILAPSVRQYRSARTMHWTLGCTFSDDDCRVRTGNAAANLVTINHIALNILKRNPAKISLPSKRLRARWNEEFLLSCLKVSA